MESYRYQWEKFSDARRCLMLPHPQGEAASIATAFHECKMGLHKMHKDELDDDSALSCLSTLEDLMSTEGLEDPLNKGTFHVKAETLSTDDKFELSRVIDELAYWFYDGI